jgi:WD40 repeat protein
VLGSATGSVNVNKALAPAPLTIDSGRYATAATMDPTSKAIYFGDDQGSLFRIDDVNQPPRKLVDGTGASMTCVKLADDGERLAIGWSDGAVGLLDLVATTMVMKAPPPTSLIGTPSAVAQIEFSPDQKQMAAFLRPNYVQYFPLDVTSQGVISESGVLCPLTEGRWMMVFTDQRQLLLLADSADRLDLSTLQSTRVADGADYLLAVCSDRNTGGIFTGARDGRLRRHATSGEIIETGARWEVDSAAGVRIASITAVAFAPDGVHLLTGSDRGDIALWERDELRFVGEVRIGDDRGPVTQIVFSADQECLMYHQLPLADQESADGSGVHLLDLSPKP